MVRNPFPLVLLVAGCAESDPVVEPGDVVDQPVTGASCAPSYTEDVSSCSPAADDYLPRDPGADAWPPCISDSGTYERIEPSVSSIARVEAYEAIGALLWDQVPTHDDFIAARVIFEEEQGLGSRVARRYDVHYPPPAAGECDEEGIAAAHPHYCVGPATLQPIVVGAFAGGALGSDRVVNAAKIGAALQWFLYVSAIKEATTCTEKPKDCDSSWAYYSGGTPRATPVGLALDIDRYAPQTHDRAYDAVLAVRCWRDLDRAVPAEELDTRDRAIAQLDRALVRGMAILIRQRLLALECATGDYLRATLAGLQILVPLLDRETRDRDPAAADLLLALVNGDAGSSVADAVAAVDSVFACP